MIEYRVYVGRKYGFIRIINHNRRICPPQKCLWQNGAVINLDFDIEVGLVRITGKPFDPFHAEYTFYLIAPNGYTPIGVLFDIGICRQESALTVMLWPVKFDASGYPWSS